MTEEKIGFFKRVYLAIKEFEQYAIFAAENLSIAIKYLLKIMLIFVLIVCGIFIYQFHTSLKGAITYFNNNIDEVYYSNGNLEVNNGEKIEIQNDNEVISFILIDTDALEEDVKEYEKKLVDYETGMIVLKDKIIYKNELLTQSLEYPYASIMANYQINEFNKQGVVDFISQIDMVSLYISLFIIAFIYLYVIYIATTFIDVLMLAVLGFIISRIVGMKIRFKATFNIGSYAITLPILLNLSYVLINTLTGFTIQYFNWMYTTISYIYVIVAILMIKADFINKQAELMKIIEEQQKVRQEMIQKEEQRKQEEEKKENKDNKDEKGQTEEEKKKTKKKQEKGLSDDGLAPQGLSELQNNE